MCGVHFKEQRAYIITYPLRRCRWSIMRSPGTVPCFQYSRPRLTPAFQRNLTKFTLNRFAWSILVIYLNIALQAFPPPPTTRIDQFTSSAGSCAAVHYIQTRHLQAKRDMRSTPSLTSNHCDRLTRFARRCCPVQISSYESTQHMRAAHAS